MRYYCCCCLCRFVRLLTNITPLTYLTLVHSSHIPSFHSLTFCYSTCLILSAVQLYSTILCRMIFVININIMNIINCVSDLILTIDFYLYSTIGQIRRSISSLFRQTYYHLSFFCIYPLLISTLSCEFSLQINTFPPPANQPRLSFSPRPLLHLHPLHGIFRLATLRFYLFSNSVLLTVFSVRDNVVIIAV